ncbi:MAG: hypothetical protein ACI4RJ_01555 [Alphaproteobacteria bacterium]
MKYAKQMPLPLLYEQANTREDFFVADCNKDAVKWIDSFPNWPSSMLLILGPASSGKTHLAHIFTSNIYSAKRLNYEDVHLMPQKFAIEDIDEAGVDEEVLFHLYNDAIQQSKNILFTAKAMPFWRLNDLKTRMNTVPTVHIGLPDDAMMMSLILKGLSERQLDIQSGVMDYILTHIERSFSAAFRFVELAQDLSLAQQHPITVPLAKQVLEQMKQEYLL